MGENLLNFTLKFTKMLKIKAKIQAFVMPKFINSLKTTAKIQGFAKKPEFSVNLKSRCSISSEKSLLANEARLKAKRLPKFVKKRFIAERRACLAKKARKKCQNSQQTLKIHNFFNA